MKTSRNQEQFHKKCPKVEAEYQIWEETLQHSESRYKSILEASNTGVWEFDSHLQLKAAVKRFTNEGKLGNSRWTLAQKAS